MFWGMCGCRYDWMKEGRDVVRVFDKNSLTWQTLPGVKLSEYRWYPTQVSTTGPQLCSNVASVAVVIVTAAGWVPMAAGRHQQKRQQCFQPPKRTGGNAAAPHQGVVSYGWLAGWLAGV